MGTWPPTTPLGDLASDTPGDPLELDRVCPDGDSERKSWQPDEPSRPDGVHSDEKRQPEGQDARPRGFPKVVFTRLQMSRADGCITKRYDLVDNALRKTPAPDAIVGRACILEKPLHEIAADVRTHECNVYGVFAGPIGADLPITTRAKARDGELTRTLECFQYRNGPGVLLVENDPHPEAVPPIPALDGNALLDALVQVFPDVADTAYVAMPSSSAGRIRRIDTGEVLRECQGLHLYLAVLDAADIPRFGKVLFARLWLAGFGSIVIARNGALLVRTLIDAAVFSPERIDYVVPAVLGAGLARDRVSPTSFRPGGYLNTRLLPDLSMEEQQCLKALVQAAKARAKPQADVVQAAYLEERTAEMVAAGVVPQVARETAKQTCVPGSNFDLYGDFRLTFAQLGTMSVADVLATPDHYDGEALSDPIEGLDYGTTTAKFYWNNGNPRIHSFAHGGVLYFLHAGWPECRKPLPDVAPDPSEDGRQGGADDRTTDHCTTDDEEIEVAEAELGGWDESDLEAKATVSARRAAFHGETKQQAMARINMQWPELRAFSSVIVDKAFSWFERYKPGQLIKLHGIGKRVTDLATLNADFALLEAPNMRACIIKRSDAMPIPAEDFGLRLAGDVVVTGIGKHGQPIIKDAGRFWWESAEKHVYRRIVFTSQSTPPDTMNLFRGWGVTPAVGDCSRILQHIFEVICSSVETDYQAMLDLIAWQMQNIGTLSRIIVVLISEQQQTGKGTLLEEVLLPIYGAAGCSMVTLTEVTGDFNDLLRGKALAFLDEALFVGDRKTADQIKGRAASPTININAKNVPLVVFPSGLNLWMASNHAVPVYVEEKDARYWPLQVNPGRYGDYDYFAALRKEIESGGREAFLHQMLERDVSVFFPPRDVPRRNAAHLELVKGGIGRSDPRHWLEECMECRKLLCVSRADSLTDVGALAWQAGTKMPPMELWQGYKSWVKTLCGPGLKTFPIHEFWKIMTHAGFDVQEGPHGTNLRVVPEIEHCAAQLARPIEGPAPVSQKVEK